MWRENSSTTKRSVVFVVSCATDNGVSLNDNWIIGHTFQDELLNIILRFRQYHIVMSADVDKINRMVHINERFRPLQCIYWCADPNEQIEVFERNTMTYGTASSAFLVRCLNQLSEDNEVSFPETSALVSRDFYVDDIISGAHSVKGALKQVHFI